MYKIHRTDGDFALKLLNPEVMARPGARDNMERSEAIARAAKAAGLPAVCALLQNGQAVFPFEGEDAMLFDWIDGKPEYRPAAEQCAQVGGLLARLHLLSLPVPRTAEEDAANDWIALARKHESIAGDGEMLEALEARSLAARKALTARVISHRDLDPKNVLWRKNEAFLIDWEAAGPVNPTSELVELALAWGQGSSEKTRAFLEGYRRAGGPGTDDPALAFAAGQKGALDWLAYQLTLEAWGVPAAGGQIALTLAQLRAPWPQEDFR